MEVTYKGRWGSMVVSMEDWAANTLRDLLAQTKWRISKETAYRFLRENSPTCKLDRRTFNKVWADLSAKIAGDRTIVAAPCKTKRWFDFGGGETIMSGRRRK